jgi:hypothetical protein
MDRQATSTSGINPLSADARWRSDVDVLIFPIETHAASCAVHRRAFRTLLRSEPTPEECLRFFSSFEEAFRAAAKAKIAKKMLPAGQNFHLTSRDVARKLLELKRKESGEQ